MEGGALLKNALFILSVIFCFSAFGQNSGKDIMLKELKEVIVKESSGARAEEQDTDPAELQALYEQNRLPVSLRLAYYKHLLGKTDIRNWPKELKAIVLIKLMKYDAVSDRPAYMAGEAGTGSFITLINAFIQEEFQFIEEWKKDIKAKLSENGEHAEEIELTEEQLQAAINEVYNKLIAEVEDANQYIF